MAAIPTLVPFGRTAQRLEWRFLPPHLRRAIEQRCGSPVVDATSQLGGYTPGFASVLTCADGGRHFVKAASVAAQRAFADAYREEGRHLAALPSGVPAPRLLWSLDQDWVVLGIEYVDSRPPHRPWRPSDLDAMLDALETTADLLTPVPAALRLDTFADEYAELASYWDEVRVLEPALARIDEAEALAVRFAEVTAGETLVHTDVRDDNTLVTANGTALLCDWNFPVAGAAWLDTVMALIGPRGDGLDVDAVLTERRLTRDVPDEHVDIVLALLAGYFLRACRHPVPPTSPHLRDFQSWQASVVWDWLAERRGWE